MSVLKTINLCKTYRRGEERVYAVKDANLTVESGEFISITGTSGSGKSTLLNLCAGILRADHGSILIDGEDIVKYDSNKLAWVRREKIGYVFQHFNLMESFTVRENILMPALLKNTAPEPEYYKYLVETLGLSDREDYIPAELSGGQMQRVAIARALINKPSILLADEPTGNLDKNTSQEVVEVLQKLNKNGSALLLVTHDMDIAKKADNIYQISDGELKLVK